MIPFTEYVLPYGRKVDGGFERSTEVEQAAHAFIERGGWFECELLATGHVSLTACWNMPDGDNDISIEIVKNGPGVGDAVDRLVAKATARDDLP
jgi:hypothetical protein